jgi:SAM-dependent methyltransferase
MNLLPLRPLARRMLPPRLRLKIADLIAGGPLRVLDSQVHAEKQIIQAELALANSREWAGHRSGKPTQRMSERVVEVPWVFSRYRQEAAVLDLGTASAFPEYVDWLQQLSIPTLIGLDLRIKPIRGVTTCVGDARKLPFGDGAFDVVFCISTIEHIGLDNSNWNALGIRGTGGDAMALHEMLRVVRPCGRVLLTVPFGRAELRSWYRQYDLADWHRLVAAAHAQIIELETYKLNAQGWERISPELAANCGYQDNGARGATAVLCAALTPNQGR